MAKKLGFYPVLSASVLLCMLDIEATMVSTGKNHLISVATKVSETSNFTQGTLTSNAYHE